MYDTPRLTILNKHTCYIIQHMTKEIGMTMCF